MTTEKAMKMIDEYLAEPNSIHKDWIEVLILCRQALEKQIPKKPLVPCGRWDGKSKGGKCPICSSQTTESVSNFCRKCGQALDWSD